MDSHLILQRTLRSPAVTPDATCGLAFTGERPTVHLFGFQRWIFQHKCVQSNYAAKAFDPLTARKTRRRIFSRATLCTTEPFLFHFRNEKRFGLEIVRFPVRAAPFDAETVRAFISGVARQEVKVERLKVQMQRMCIRARGKYVFISTPSILFSLRLAHNFTHA